MQFVKMAWLDFKGNRSVYNFEELVTLEILYPFVTLIFYCITAGYAHQNSNIITWVVGNAFLLCTNICIFHLGIGFIGERYTGRICSIITGNLSKIIIILQKGFFSIFLSIFTTFFGFFMGCMVFGIDMKPLPWGSIVITFSAGMFSAVGFGLFISVFGLISDQMYMILNLTQCLLLILSGANFPVSQLPYIVQKLSYVLPLTRGISATQTMLTQASAKLPVHLVLGELLVGGIYFVLAALFIKRIERSAIKRGGIELF